jgi:hypothetical protein
MLSEEWTSDLAGTFRHELGVSHLERPVEYWRFPEEGHELSRSGSPRHRVQRAEIILDWFGRHLGGRRPPIDWDHPSTR